MKETLMLIGFTASCLATMWCVFKTFETIEFFREMRRETKDSLARIETKLKEPKP